jgi:hypothetical protein
MGKGLEFDKKILKWISELLILQMEINNKGVVYHIFRAALPQFFLPCCYFEVCKVGDK